MGVLCPHRGSRGCDIAHAHGYGIHGAWPSAYRSGVAVLTLRHPPPAGLLKVSRLWYPPQALGAQSVPPPPADRVEVARLWYPPQELRGLSGPLPSPAPHLPATDRPPRAVRRSPPDAAAHRPRALQARPLLAARVPPATRCRCQSARSASPKASRAYGALASRPAPSIPLTSRA